jgi:hypothetical protein
MTRCWGLLWINLDVNIKFHGNRVVEGMFLFHLQNLHIIWSSRTPQRAIGMSQPDYHKLPRKKMNKG